MAAKPKAPKVGAKVTVLLGPKWPEASAPGRVTRVAAADFDGHPVVDVEFTALAAVPFQPDAEPERRAATIVDVFLFDTAADARKWVKAGHQSVGVHRTAG